MKVTKYKLLFKYVHFYVYCWMVFNYQLNLCNRSTCILLNISKWNSRCFTMRWFNTKLSLSLVFSYDKMTLNSFPGKIIMHKKYFYKYQQTNNPSSWIIEVSRISSGAHFKINLSNGFNLGNAMPVNVDE